MILFGSELFGAFLLGAVTALVVTFFVGRRLVRKKLGGLLDMTSISAKP